MDPLESPSRVSVSQSSGIGPSFGRREARCFSSTGMSWVYQLCAGSSRWAIAVRYLAHSLRYSNAITG